jgi:hypothetical protein
MTKAIYRCSPNRYAPGLTHSGSSDLAGMFVCPEG